jgi:hypothetical protein
MDESHSDSRQFELDSVSNKKEIRQVHILYKGFILANSSIFHFNKLLSFIERISNTINIYNEGKYL